MEGLVDMTNTFYHGDCLFVMKHDIQPDSTDLIYLDPPFFTGKIQKGKWRPEAMEVSYEDSRRFWSTKADIMREKAPFWLRHIALKRPDFASYLWYMMERLQACERVLGKTATIYLHCDYRASHYLKMVMDEVFGFQNFRNEIVWCYSGGGIPKRDFPRKHDTIFRYTKGEKYTFNVQYKPYSEGTVQRGRTKVKGKYAEQGLRPEGTPVNSWWHDINAIHSPTSYENAGYPTQKPEALLERIIKVSSDEGNVVLDPFCGCGTTAIVASKLNRGFIGIDIDTSEREKGELPTAFSVIKNRSHQLFDQTVYVSRDLSEVLEMDGWAFEAWVNEYYKATKPQPDRGVDGITSEGIPIQSKVHEIKYDKLSQFINDVKYHPKVPKPIKKVIAVSQTGFDDTARKLKFEVETREGIDVQLVSPQEMLDPEKL